MSKVYVLECNGLHKIGVAQDVESRVKQLQTGNGNRIVEVTSYEFFSMAYWVESYLHKEFTASKTIGEWFNFSDYELGSVKLMLKFEYDKLQLVGNEEVQKIYTELYTQAFSSTNGLKEVLIEMANIKFPVES
jgi:hypothetical protein